MSRTHVGSKQRSAVVPWILPLSLAISLMGCERGEVASAPPLASKTSKPRAGASAADANAKALAAQGDYEAAAKALAQELAGRKGTPSDYATLAAYAYVAGDYPAAEGAVTQGLALGQDGATLSAPPEQLAELWYQRGRVAQAMGRVADARAAYAKAVAASDHAAAQYWLDTLPVIAEVPAGDAAAICAALTSYVATAYEAPSTQVACKVEDASTVFPDVATAALLGKVAVVTFVADAGASREVWALWQQADRLAVRGRVTQTLGEGTSGALRQVELGTRYLAISTQTAISGRDVSTVATDVLFCADGAQGCSLVVRTNYEAHAEAERSDRAIDTDEAAVAWSTSYGVVRDGVLTVSAKSGKPPAGLLGMHRVY